MARQNGFLSWSNTGFRNGKSRNYSRENSWLADQKSAMRRRMTGEGISVNRKCEAVKRNGVAEMKMDGNWGLL